MADELAYICKRTVVSAKPVQPDKYHELSALDCLMEPNRHLMMVYYYRTGRSREAAGSVGEATRRLREGLSEALTYFPAVTGRLLQGKEEEDQGQGQGSKRRSKWVVRCNDAGVRVVEACVRGSVDDWLRNVDWEKEKRLIHWEEMYHKPYFWSTFYVQLTEFEEGGLAIGLSCTHLLSDPICATMFMKAWADVTLRGKMTHPPLFHPLPAHQPGTRSAIRPIDPFTDLCGRCQSPATLASPTSVHNKHSTISLSFSDQTVRSCMEKSAGGGGGEGGSPSPFEAVTGLIWAAVSRVRGLDDGLVGLTIGLDMRRVLGLDDGFFGNCMVYAHIQPELGENGLTAAAAAIRDRITKFEKERVKDLIEWLEHDDGTEPTQRMLIDSELMCVNLDTLDLGWTIFEDGSSPIRISHYMEPVCNGGQFLILPSPSGDGPFGRVVTITLPEEEVDRLLRDDLINDFGPTVLIGAITAQA
ncbi:hypothetical protein SAY86_002958 [Trapa natans]|uniref:Uncharacterized protein n=1 Tax=Trapa natans TaxID=22666 RepID=A0AAN7LL40_TRANT|nr:hypothetical protein SAY86_002958 [Trapa natans]